MTDRDRLAALLHKGGWVDGGCTTAITDKNGTRLVTWEGCDHRQEHATMSAWLIAAGVTSVPDRANEAYACGRRDEAYDQSMRDDRLRNPCRVCGEPAVVAYTLCGKHATEPIPFPLAGYAALAEADER